MYRSLPMTELAEPSPLEAADLADLEEQGVPGEMLARSRYP